MDASSLIFLPNKVERIFSTKRRHNSPNEFLALSNANICRSDSSEAQVFRKIVFSNVSSPKFNMGVSKIRGTPKWMVYNGKPYQNWWFGGTPIFGNTYIDTKNDPKKSDGPWKMYRIETASNLESFWIYINSSNIFFGEVVVCYLEWIKEYVSLNSVRHDQIFLLRKCKRICLLRNWFWYCKRIPFRQMTGW